MPSLASPGLILVLLLGQLSEEQVEKPNVFDLPRVQARYVALQAQAQALFKLQKYTEAEDLARSAIKLIPHEPTAHYNLACALARQEKPEPAMTALREAVTLGFRDAKQMAEDPDLASLKERDDFKTLLAAAPDAKPPANAAWQYDARPAAVAERVATVSAQNVAYDPRAGAFLALFAFPETKPDVPPIKGFGEAGELVNKWFAEGTAAGNLGDLYDNHDRDHSNMDYDSFPQLTRIEFEEAAKSRNLDYGLQLAFLYNAPTIGNSSTAHVHGVFWRCQGRFALTQPRGAELLYQQYANNQLFFYPEHRDHDPGHNGAGDGYGDVLPANTPYLLLSQGSSGSDRPLMHAAALAMAALRPEVKAELVKQHALMPALQMLLRRAYEPAGKPEEYLTGAVHPSVFEGEKFNLVRLVNLAHDMTREQLPPVALIQVLEEDKTTLGVEYFDFAERERLFDTPDAIARVIKAAQRERRFVVSAKASRDLTGQKLKYHFVVLRGDPAKIQITPQADDPSTAEIKVQYHERRPVLPGSAMESNRVDIGAFVENEKQFSAPAFLSLLYLDDEKRIYDEAGRIASIDYADPEIGKNYVDPVLDAKRSWRDEYHYGASGELLGWTRVRGEARQEFTFAGHLVTKSDDSGRPLLAKAVRYELRQERDQAPRLEQVETDEAYEYRYTGDERRGTATKVTK
jgi:hypothetical protein